MGADLSGVTLFDPARDGAAGREPRYVSPAERAAKARDLSLRLSAKAASKLTNTTAAASEINAVMKGAKVGDGVGLTTDIGGVRDRAIVFIDVVNAMREAAGYSGKRYSGNGKLLGVSVAA